MKTNQKTSKKLLLATSALSLGFLAGGFALLGGEKAAAEDQPVIPTNCEISVESGTSLKLNDHGGLRFIFKMNTAMKEYIKDNDTNDSVKLIAHVGPAGKIATKYVSKAIDEGTLYSDSEGNWYANVCLVGVRPQNRELEYTAQAFVKNGETVVKTAENAKASGSFYDVATRALLDTEEDYTQRILNLSSYSWLGADETFPLYIDSLDLYNGLVTKINEGADFSKKYVAVRSNVDVTNGTDLNEGKQLPENNYRLSLVTFKDGEKELGSVMVKNGSVATFETPADRTDGDDKLVFEKWVTENGGDDEADLSAISGDAVVYAKFRTVHSNSISWSVAPHDISYGVTPDFAATAGYGTPELTYATAQNGEYKAWDKLENHNVGTYYVKASVDATDEYDGAEATASFKVEKATNNTIADFTMASIIHCNDTPAPSATATHGKVEYQYSKLADKDFVDLFENAKYPGVGNFTYYVRAVVKETDNYTGAESEVKSFRFEHEFVDGVCSLGGTAHTQSGIAYEIDGDVACIAGYTGNHSTEVYPVAEYEGKPVAYVKNGCAWNPNTTKIVLPASVTDFGGNSFVAAENLEYISITGVKHISTDNNFLNCTKIKTVIVNKDLQLDNQQFKKHNTSESAQGIIYVDGAIGESTFRFTAPASNEYLTGTIFYKGDASKCGQWNYGENGEVAYGAAHNYENGICKECGKYSAEKTSWVIYGYKAPAKDNSNGVYYVGMNKNLDLKNVKILEKYNDGIHGELPVTYVQEMAFQDNPYIERVILPDSVKSLNGSVFAGCSKLTFVSMTGVENLQYHGSSLGYVDGRGNNFINCTALKYVVLNPNFSTDAQQFFAGTAPTQPILDIYVNAASGTPNFGGANTNLLTGTIYYKGDATKCLQWNYDSNGEIIHGAAEHNYEAGICTACGKYSEEKTQGVVYGYDATENNGKGGYYVGLNQTLNLSVVEILGTYNDGIHGELSVTYVRNSAFNGNPYITKVILPESVTQLDGNVFLNCSNLQYVSMLGIKNMTFKGISRLYSTETIITGNNFLGCSKLTTLIVNKEFNLFDDPLALNAQQFVGSDACINIYAFGGKDDSNVIISKEGTTGNNNLLTGTIYYYSETQKSGCWHYVDDNGNVAIWE